MKSPLVTPATVLGAVAVAFALMSAIPSFIGLLITPLAMLLAVVALVLGYLAAGKSEDPVRLPIVLGYVALGITVGWFILRTVLAMLS